MMCLAVHQGDQRRRAAPWAGGTRMEGDRWSILMRSSFFSFQAEDGIRDLTVTGDVCSSDLIHGQSYNSEHQMRHHLRRSAHANVPASELILNTGVDAFAHGALFVALLLRPTQLTRW